MSKHRYYNATDSSYTMDAAGHVLGGGETGTFNSSDQINRGVATGKLIDKGEVEEEKNEEKNNSEQSGEAPANPEPKKTATSRRGRSANEEEQS